jgi:hypothetical protein
MQYDLIGGCTMTLPFSGLYFTINLALCQVITRHHPLTSNIAICPVITRQHTLTSNIAIGQVCYLTYSYVRCQWMVTCYDLT